LGRLKTAQPAFNHGLNDLDSFQSRMLAVISPRPFVVHPLIDASRERAPDIGLPRSGIGHF
jgi:hypothetical protein